MVDLTGLCARPVGNFPNASGGGLAVTAGITLGFNTPGKVSITVPSYKTLVIELWGGGNSGAQAGAGTTSIASLSLVAPGAQNGGGSSSTTASGGDVNKPCGVAASTGQSGAAYNGGVAQNTTATGAVPGSGVGNAPGGGGAPTSSSSNGGDAGSYCKKTYVAGTAGAPAPGSILAGIVGPADIQTGTYQGSLVYNSGANGRIALTVLS